MEKVKIERINFLARKSKSEGLTEQEKSEQEQLRYEYRKEFLSGFASQLDSTYVVTPDGKKKKLVEGKVKE